MHGTQYGTAVRRGWGMYLAARDSAAYALMWVVVLAVVAVDAWTGITVFEIRFSEWRVPRYTPMTELLPVLAGVLGAALLVPRLWSWERMAHDNRLRCRAVVCAVVALVLPALIPWITHFLLPPDARWWDITCNIVLLSAVAMIATLGLGRVFGPLVGVGFYAAVIAVQQLAPDVAQWLPVSGSTMDLRAHPTASLLMAVLAVAAWGVTLGSSRLAGRISRNESS